MIKQVLEKMKSLFARLSQLSQTKFHIRKKELPKKKKKTIERDNRGHYIIIGQYLIQI